MIEETLAQSSGIPASAGQEESLQGQPSEPEATSVEQAQEASPETAPIETDYQKQYNELQPEFTRKSQALKEAEANLSKFEPYGGVDKIMESVEYLQDNPRFADFLKAEQERDVYGFNPDEQDTESREALKLVEKVVDQRVAQELEKLKTNELNPLIEKNREENVKHVFSQMDEQFPDWREVQESMTELASGLPESVTDNPKFNDVVGLYYRALAESPDKMSEFSARQHEKKIESAKKKTIDKPGRVQAGSQGNASSISEAFNMAKTS